MGFTIPKTVEANRTSQVETYRQALQLPSED